MSRWAGMMTMSTLAAMMVPIAAPTWRYAARGLRSWASPHASAVASRNSVPPRASGLAPSAERHRASYTSQLTISVATPTPTAAPDESRAALGSTRNDAARSEEHTSELQSRLHLVCRLLLEKKKRKRKKV